MCTCSLLLLLLFSSSSFFSSSESLSSKNVITIHKYDYDPFKFAKRTLRRQASLALHVWNKFYTKWRKSRRSPRSKIMFPNTIGTIDVVRRKHIDRWFVMEGNIRNRIYDDETLIVSRTIELNIKTFQWFGSN